MAASDGAANDWFGDSAISGDTLVVGAYGDDSYKGAAYVFARNWGGADQWGQAQKLTAADGVAGDIFGVSVALSGDAVVVGADGISSHDTFGRVFNRLDAEQFQPCFLNWMQAVSRVFKGQVVPIDGKTLRRSHDKAIGKGAIHMVSAWALENQLVLGQVKVDEKSNEITAIPQLLEALAISGCIVTIDALGCQKEIAHQIMDQGADYVLALKENQGGLYAAVEDLLGYAQETDFADCDYHRTVDKGHGRIEICECWTISAEDYLQFLPNRSAWPGLQTIVMIKSERRIGHKTTIQVRHYISSLVAGAKPHLKAVRGHWGIENQVHWGLDVALREDDCRIRKGNGPQNFAS